MLPAGVEARRVPCWGAGQAPLAVEGTCTNTGTAADRVRTAHTVMRTWVVGTYHVDILEAACLASRKDTAYPEARNTET